MITCGGRTKFSITVCTPTRTYSCTQCFQNYSLIIFNRWCFVTREMQCLNLELVGIHCYLVRGGFEFSEEDALRHFTYEDYVMHHSSDSDPLLYQSPPETIDKVLHFAGFGPSSLSWGSCWTLVPLLVKKMARVFPQHTRSWCRSLFWPCRDQYTHSRVFSLNTVPHHWDLPYQLGTILLLCCWQIVLLMTHFSP